MWTGAAKGERVMSVKRVISLGLFVGLLGAGLQIPLLRLGLLASAPMRGMLSLFLAIAIGFTVGTWAPREGAKAAALAGVIAGAIFALIGLGALLRNPSVSGQAPLDSPQAFFLFVSSLIISTVIVSWVFAGVAVLVALPIGLSRVQEENRLAGFER